jgi:two-component system chemotaxis sensor kinase CheA
MLADFLDESSQLLLRLNENLLRLDDWVHALADGAPASCDEQLMNELFRAAHSLKGLSAMLGLADINALTHKIENVFDAARRDELRFEPHTVELVFQSVDRLSAMVEYLKDPTPTPPDYSEVAAEIQDVLERCGRSLAAGDQADVEKHFASEKPVPAIPDKAPKVVTPRGDLFADILDETDVPAKYLGIFIDETEMSLDTFVELLIRDDGRTDRSGTESLMIISHRIKGSAASIGLNRAAKLSHCMEDLLQERLERNADLTPHMADVLLRCGDALRRYIDGLKIGAPDTARFSEAYQSLLALQLESPTAAPAVAAPITAKIVRMSDDERAELRRAGQAAGDGVIGRVRFQADFPLVGLKARLVYERLVQLGEIFHCDPTAEALDALEQIEFLKFGVATTQDAANVATRLKIVGVAEVEAEPLNASAVTAAPAAQFEAPRDRAATTDESKTQENRPVETLRVDIERLDQLMNLAGQLVINKARFARIGEGLKQTTGNKRLRNRLDDVFGQLQRLDGAMDRDEDRSVPVNLPVLQSQVRSIQRDLGVLRGELERLASARSSINDLFEAVHQLDRVAEGIQRTVMDTRMVPIGPLFTRFRRVIRDITRSNGKDVRLEILGEKTELDKRMIDELGDPLIHMVRNSADHGIEQPETRIAAGKPAQGVITLNAFHRGNRIVIQVTDDGKGLDPDRIRQKAVDRGLISPSDAERMTPQQIYNLIWEPGFSTAEQVTEISGRGMGMDIVKSKIEELNGAVDVDSVPGQGVTLTIKLPLTMAILPSLMAEVDGGIFALPIESVVEIVRIGADKVNTVHGVPTSTVRGRVVSIVRLDELFEWNGSVGLAPPDPQADITMVILGSEGRELGLTVNHLLGEEDIVIKSLAENYRHVTGVAGASILGDGRVALILDIAALVEAAQRRGAAAEALA